MDLSPNIVRGKPIALSQEACATHAGAGFLFQRVCYVELVRVWNRGLGCVVSHDFFFDTELLLRI